MKVTSDNVKAGLMLAAAGVAVYAAYRVFKVGDSAATAVSDTVASVGDWFKEKKDAIAGAVSSAADSVSHAFDPPIDTDAPYPEPAPVRAAVLQAQVTPAGVAGASFEDYSSGAVLDMYGSSGGSLGSDSRVMQGAWVRSPDSFEGLSERL